LAYRVHAVYPSPRYSTCDHDELVCTPHTKHGIPLQATAPVSLQVQGGRGVRHGLRDYAITPLPTALCGSDAYTLLAGEPWTEVASIARRQHGTVPSDNGSSEPPVPHYAITHTDRRRAATRATDGFDRRGDLPTFRCTIMITTRQWRTTRLPSSTLIHI
jgi:hypothetical protein